MTADTTADAARGVAWNVALAPLNGPLPIRRGSAGVADWTAAAFDAARADARLVALWGSDRRRSAERSYVVSALYGLTEGLVWLELPVENAADGYPDLAGLFPCAGRMQRALADLLGLAAREAEDARPWLAHGAWPADYYPLRGDVGAQSGGTTPGPTVDYAFVRVEGDGVHEIPVGPVHAGIIEPGHFRFSVVGEKVLRLEQRLGYKHKGIEQRFTGLPPGEAYRLAGRVSGDSTVAYAWAYCMALESAMGCAVPARAAWLRALMLERERVANHLGDLGALGNDAALAFGLAQFSRLKEDWLRLSQLAFGHRMMMDCVVPGGVAVNPGTAVLDAMRRQCDALEPEVLELRKIYDEHAGLQDRFMGTGQVSAELARRLGLTGLAARASGRALDLRHDHPVAPYDTIGAKVATHAGGDVAARVAVRFDEVLESLRMVRLLCERLPPGAAGRELPADYGGRYGMGWIEGWRGEIVVALELEDGADGPRIARCHAHDPSWQNWPVLEHAIIGNIVPDFPLINKSFNLSYAGHDL